MPIQVIQIERIPIQKEIGTQGLMPLGERDQKLIQLEAEIEAKRNWLLERRKVLKKNVKNNQFLHGVKEDYEKFYNYTVKQKENQLKAFTMLNQYVSDIIISGKLTDRDIQRSKEEQEQIVGEMEKIKRNLDKIMKEEE
jgi:hypothetical protein